MGQHIICNLCGADNYDVVFDTDFGKIVQCRDCELMYLTPRQYVDPSEVDRYYEDERWHEQYLKKQHIQTKDYGKILPVLNSLLHGKKKLLEIGSYVGTFLKLAKDTGWDVTGLEPSNWCIEYAKRHLGLDLHNKFLKEAQFADESYDAVVLLHVIEHLEDASSEIKEIHRIMKKGGIFVIETPRYDTIWFKWLKGRERSVIKDHYLYFTLPSLKKIMEKHGFIFDRAESVGRTLTIDRLLMNVMKVLNSNKLFSVYNYLSPKLMLDKIQLHVNTGDMIRMYVRKQ